MELNESVRLLLNQGMEELSTVQISFGLKLLIMFGVIFLFSTISKTGFSIIHFLIYVVAFFKWVIYKIKGKEV